MAVSNPDATPSTSNNAVHHLSGHYYGTWDEVLAELLGQAHAADQIDWSVAVDSTICRAHQHGTTLTRDTGGPVESHESALRAC